MTRLFLVRHGETDWNREERAQGQSDTPLNADGRGQAERVAERLAPVPFVAAYSSDLSRVVETATPIMRDRDIQLVTMSELREKSFGEWEGMTFRELESRYPNGFRQMFADDVSFAPPGGESDSQLFARIDALANRLLATHGRDGGNVLVASHGGTLRALVTSLLGLPVESMWRFRLANAGLSVVSVVEGGGATLDMLNDTSHLGDGSFSS